MKFFLKRFSQTLKINIDFEYFTLKIIKRNKGGLQNCAEHTSF